MSPLVKYALFVLLGISVGVGSTVAVRYLKELQENKGCAHIVSGGKAYVVTQEGWDFAQKAIREQHATIERLGAELEEAKANPAAKMLAKTGHMMNEEQCRAWLLVPAH